MLFQPSNISPDEITGTGCIDTAKDMTVSWQVNGDSAMSAYQIDIYDNNAASTLKYSTGKKTLSAPFWGVNFKGETQYFRAEITSAALAEAGIINGSEYKLLITQWWGSESIQQTTASVFKTRATPAVSINTIPNPVTTKSFSFTGVYTQAQGDALKWVRWMIAEKGQEAAPFLNTGKISGTGELRVDYDGFFTKTRYVIRCDVETINGIEATSGWVEFLVDYAVTAPQGNVQACQIADDSAVYIRWDRMEVAFGYSVLRQKEGERVLHKVADVDGTTGQLRDYGVRSGETYIYYVFPMGELAYLTQPMVSEPVPIAFHFWSIIEAKETGRNLFSAITSYLFKMGSGGVSEGEFSNNNKPQMIRNFTPYPIRQGDTANFLSGSVGGFIGRFSNAKGLYEDNISDSDRLMRLSTTRNALFLLDPKGHFLRIHTNSAITLRINHKNAVMPQTMTLKWSEIGSTEGVSLYSAPGGDFFPSDAVVSTKFRVNTETGALIWETPDDYANGSTMKLSSDGELIQNADGAFTPAALTLDSSTMTVTAEIS